MRTTDTVKMKSTGASSAKFGPCEICGRQASEVFHLWGRTNGKHISLFGCKECLEKTRS